MKHSTPKPLAIQKSFADIPPEKFTPIPLAASLRYNFPLQHYEPTEAKQEYLYSIQDWIAGITGSKNPRQVWADLKRRYAPEKLKPNSRIDKSTAEAFQKQLLDGCQQLPYTASDGKNYQMDFAPDTILFLIVQFVEADTGVKLAISSYLAQAGHDIEDWKRNPEKMLSAAQARMQSDIERHEKAGLGNRPEIELLKSQLELSQTLKEIKSSVSRLLELSKGEWGTFHNEEMWQLLGYTAKQIQDARDPKKSARANLNIFEANGMKYGEQQLIALLSMQKTLDPKRLNESVKFIFAPIGENLRGLLESIGIDALSGKYQLPSGK